MSLIFNIKDGDWASVRQAISKLGSIKLGQTSTPTFGGVSLTTALTVANGGTGATTLTDGGLLLGSGTGAITAMDALADSEMIVGNGTTDPVAESGATLRTSIGVGTGDSPQLTGIELGHASDTTLTRASAGDVNIESNIIYRAGGTDVPITDGGTGQSTAQTAINALSAVSGATNEHVLTKDTATGNAIFKAVSGGDDEKVGIDSGATAGYLGAASNDGVLRTGAGITYADGGDFVTLSPDLVGDGTAGRVLRFSTLQVIDGTNAATVRCVFFTNWNGDTIASTDNCSKGATTGNFTVAADGTEITVEAAGLSGNVLFAFAVIINNGSGTALMIDCYPLANDIIVRFRDAASGAELDATTLADSGAMEVQIMYFTDA